MRKLFDLAIISHALQQLPCLGVCQAKFPGDVLGCHAGGIGVEEAHNRIALSAALQCIWIANLGPAATHCVKAESNINLLDIAAAPVERDQPISFAQAGLQPLCSAKKNSHRCMTPNQTASGVTGAVHVFEKLPALLGY